MGHPTTWNGCHRAVFKPIRVGSLDLSNHIIFPAVQTNYANIDGTVSDKLLEFYTELATGGSSAIITGAAVVSPDTVTFDRVMRVDSDACIPGLKVLFRRIESAGSVPGIQLIHYGRQALRSVTGHDLLAPSAVPCPLMSTFETDYRVVEMTLGAYSDTQKTVRQRGGYAARARPHATMAASATGEASPRGAGAVGGTTQQAAS